MSGALPVRVTVLDSWDEVLLLSGRDTPVGEVKAQALAAARTRGAADEFLVKYLGAELFDEAASLADAGVAPNGALIVVRRRRTPTR